jgi:hypothetical protein
MSQSEFILFRIFELTACEEMNTALSFCFFCVKTKENDILKLNFNNKDSYIKTYFSIKYNRGHFALIICL